MASIGWTLLLKRFFRGIEQGAKKLYLLVIVRNRKLNQKNILMKANKHYVMTRKRNKYWIKVPLKDEIEIIIAGFFGGIVPGIGIKTGVSLDRSDWSIMILKEVCSITEGDIHFNCYLLVTCISLLAAFFAFLPVWKKARKIRNLRVINRKIPGFLVGLLLYCIGFISGVSAVINLF